MVARAETVAGPAEKQKKGALSKQRALYRLWAQLANVFRAIQ
jgi:hypothetical protein